MWHQCDALAVAFLASYDSLEFITHSLTCGDAPDMTLHSVSTDDDLYSL